MKASGPYKNMRKVKYSSTFKPLKEFNLQPAYERLWRLNLNNPMAYTQKMIELGFNIVTAGSDKIFMVDGAKSAVSKLKK